MSAGAVAIIIAIIVGLFLSYQDLKFREISVEPLILVVLVALLTHYFDGSLSSSIIGLLSSFALGLLLMFLGVWALGDVLFLAAYGAVLGLGWWTGVYYLTNSLVIIVPFVVAYLLYAGVKKMGVSVLAKVGREAVSSFVRWLGAFSLAFCVYFTLNLVGVRHQLVSSLLVSGVVFGFFITLKKQTVVLPVSIGMFALSGIIGGLNALFVIVSVTLLPTVVYFPLIVHRVTAKDVLRKKKKVEELKEGEVLNMIIYEDDDGIHSEEIVGLKGMVEAQIKRKSAKKIYYIMDSGGLTQDQLVTLRKLVWDGKIPNEFVVATSVPFIPALFVGFVITALCPTCTIGFLGVLRELIIGLG